MTLLVAASTLSFIGVGGFVGVKLLLLWRRTGMLPELAVGLGLFLVALVGYPLGLVALVPDADPTLARICFSLGALTVNAGSISIYVFTWRVFRPSESWASAVAWSAMISLAVLAVVSVVYARPGRIGMVDPALVPRQLIVGLSYVWTAIEAVRYWGMLRKRLALGLAEPAVANRFLLWGLAGVFASAGIGISTWVALSGVDPTGNPVSMLAVGTAGFVTSIALYLAFVPPASYLRWIEARTAPAAA